MSNRMKARGTRWESAIRDYLLEEGIEVHRQPAHGVNDKGDLHIGTDIIVEAKNQARHSLGEWLDEALTEAHNAGRRVGVAWFHRRGRGKARDGYVLMDGATFVYLVREAGMAGRAPAPQRLTAYDVILGAPEQAERYELRRTT